MNLSQREYDVAELIAWGASDKEVAQELGITADTARTHRKNILRKIKGHNAADLTRWFFCVKCKVSFGINPRTVRHLACMFLILVGVSQFCNTEMVRTRPMRTVSSRAANRSGRRRRTNTYLL